MLKQVAHGVLVHESEFIQSNSVVVQGRDGVLLIDPGITRGEMADLANDVRELGQPVVAGFSTHLDWDHVLWHTSFGAAPRYGTARCAASGTYVVRARPGASPASASMQSTVARSDDIGVRTRPVPRSPRAFGGRARKGGGLPGVS